MVPSKVKPQLPKPEVKREEKISNDKFVEEYVEKVQESKVTSQHEEKISTFVLKTINKVGTLKTYEEEVMGFNSDEDVKDFDGELSMYSKGIKDLKVYDLDYGLNLNMIMTNPIKFSMVSNDDDFIAIEDLVIIDKEFITRCFNSWVDHLECGRRVKKHKESTRVNVKRKSIEDKVRREKVFEVDEALDSENSRASSF